MFNFIDVEQNTDEWLALRAGKFTSSKNNCVMAHLGKAFGEPAKQYAVNIAIEQITGQPISGGYSNSNMERGHEQEQEARELYEIETFSTVTNGGFFDCGFVGCSPDGLVGDDGLIEIKSVIPSVHYNNIKRGGLDPAYSWQFIGNLKATGREWLDFVSYCADFPEGKKLFIHRIYSKDYKEEFKQLDQRTAEFKALVELTKRKILESNYSNI